MKVCKEEKKADTGLEKTDISEMVDFIVREDMELLQKINNSPKYSEKIKAKNKRDTMKDHLELICKDLKRN